MHEVRVNVPEQHRQDVVRTALKTGIKQVSVYQVFVHGPDQPRNVISAETSTPRAHAFIDALLSSSWFDPKQCSLSSRELRAIVSAESVAELTRPRVEPAVDVLEDLWQLSHITASYTGRAVSAAILLAYSMLENSSIGLVVAALFMPFLSQIMAVSFGVRIRERALAVHGLLAVAVSVVACVASGALVAAIHGGPLLFTDFKRPAVSFAISAVIGAAAGLAISDDASRRYMIGVAAAVQYAIFPVWFGIALVIGFPDLHTSVLRLESFVVNLVTIAATSAVTYSARGVRRAHQKIQ